ncbi:MAG: TauD/TfdA family dioxygenase [Thalassolituus sp.]|jgi:hypothetical protein|uniref:TauD/TfdA-like domain-containing protein n=2 Tax=root TaxID=1 RepID=M5DV44_9GAMM|nr:TauD/TfdA family dioxygenase [Thalassolituus oleivorans]PCI50615.1 MAG: hypothetical protein COB43_00335 [Oceanospirillales bacterium]PHQ85811.1 MAG: hypothetical protein COB58_08790 [Thalassobium sp.]AHK15164.1 hypothetical protein R615_04075 [Thalassolituus oleivorans R6-15]MCA6128356.1 hypothetical protein [Thalassolituus oleivorans 4BN06-13]MDF1641745.1 TauD/TfdA family dioxygenase [Thalassolituus oleivorans]
MSSTDLPLQSLVKEDNSHEFLTIFTPQSADYKDQLLTILQNHKAYFEAKITERGGILFRGFSKELLDEDFHNLVTQGMGFEAWNAFNSKGTPKFIANWLRKYSEKLLGAGDYRRYLGTATVQLGPVQDTIQGPHVEGGGLVERSRYLALCCFEPSPYLAETGMVDLASVYESLSEPLKQKFRQGWNTFSYVSARKLNWFDRQLLKQSPLKVTLRSDGYAVMTSKPCPAACKIPNTETICVQPWAFARNTNTQVHAAAKEIFTNRGDFKKDNVAESMNLTWDLANEAGDSLNWTEAEQYEFFASIFNRATLMEWEKGDVAFIDNVRVGHWRMNGEQGNRKLVQIQANPFNSTEHMVEQTLNGQAVA